MGDLSRHFSRKEFACRGQRCCGRSAPVDLRLVQALEELREVVNQIVGSRRG